MKKITLFLFLITASFGFSQNTETVDLSATWNGYMNVFDNPADATPDCGGGFCFGSGWALGDLVAVIGASDVTLSPNVNTYADNVGGAPGDINYWTNSPDGGTTPGTDGNKLMEANFFVEPGPTYNNVDLTFTGEITNNTLDARYTAVVFIKTIGGTNLNKTIPVPSSGVFSLTATAAELASGVVQYGFAITGLNANPADNWGSIAAQPVVLSTDDFGFSQVSVYPNPAQDEWNIKTNGQNINSVQVFDMLGKNVMSVTPNKNDVTLDASELPSGLYFARLTSESGTKSIKLIKQ